MAKRVVLATRDLVFRSKLAAVVTAGGGRLTQDAKDCDLAVVEIAAAPARALDDIRALVASGVPVLAFGSHVAADLLRAAREAGATAVPNSAIVERLRELLEEK